jgi:hypothetical protein
MRRHQWLINSRFQYPIMRRYQWLIDSRFQYPMTMRRHQWLRHSRFQYPIVKGGDYRLVESRRRRLLVVTVSRSLHPAILMRMRVDT